MKRGWLMAGVCLVACLVAGACGVPSSGDFQAIPEDEFPRSILETRPTTTTTTTTSTTTTTTTVPRTTKPTAATGPTTTSPRTTTTSSTTTTTVVPTELVSLYYVQGTKVRPVVISEKAPVSQQRKLLDLAERVGMTSGPIRLATVLPDDANTSLFTPGTERGVVTIELGSSVDNVDPQDLPLFFAQIVLTTLAPAKLGQVVFTQRGVPYPAVKGDGTALLPGVPAVWEDYQDLIVENAGLVVVDPNAATSTTLPR